MKLLIKQRVFSWGDAYDIYDENGNVKYVVKAEIFALGHQLHVYDANGFEIGRSTPVYIFSVYCALKIIC